MHHIKLLLVKEHYQVFSVFRTPSFLSISNTCKKKPEIKHFSSTPTQKNSTKTFQFPSLSSLVDQDCQCCLKNVNLENTCYKRTNTLMYNHRISLVGKDPQGSSSPTPCSSQDYLKLNHMTESIVQILLELRQAFALLCASNPR